MESTKAEVVYDVLSCLPEQSDTKELFATKCNNVEEKYRLLEARDKVLRARVPKVKVRVEFATRLYGTCGDMCPEKERYMRQYQRQLTSFEIDQDSPEVVVDHRRAIKAYSRSSADQDEPLPHDLRPGSTLDMTFNYLLHHIVPMADMNEDVLGDWYNFLWDRTRSIRKDITQQQLTDLRVVSLMEKCTRFHIHCSSRLCELDVHLFDPKLNDENLMKCLQSLEHLYDDLRRRDIKCPNEPEFRAYQIMMNLNEGDILLSVQQRPEWILKSPEVQAAIKLHHYIYSKNFVGFFRLVTSFPYMFSCISHRYFYQVRYRGLMSMCRSSTGKKGDVQLVLSQVQRMLGFGEDPSLDFQTFCDIHGLLVDVENDRILYNRRRFVRPESTVINREFYLIEAKLTTSTAEAINGNPLPEDPLLTYQPHNSFDAEGFLKPGSMAGKSSATEIVPKPGQDFITENRVPEDDTFAAAAFRKTKMIGFMEKKPATISKTAEKAASIFKAPSMAKSASIFKAPFMEKPATIFKAPSMEKTASSIFKSPFEGLGAFSRSNFGGNQPLFGGSSTGFGNLSLTTPLPPPTVVSNTFGNLMPLAPPSSVPTIFVSQPPVDLELLEREAKAKKLQLIDTACSEAFDKMLQTFMEQELKLSAKDAIDKNIEERELQERLRRKEEIRSRMAEQAMDRVLSRVVPFCVSSIVHEEVQRHRWMQSVCELYANKAIESMVTFLVEPICVAEVSNQRAENEKRLRRATNILKRLQLRLILHKWLAFAKAKQLARRLKEEQLLQDMLNFPAANPVGQSPKEMLHNFRGNGISPNITKTNMSTKTWLDNYERAEALAEKFKNSVSTFVMQQYDRSSGPSVIDLEIEESKRRASEEYKRHCWKRRWSTTFDPSDSDVDKFGGRKSKSPRQEFMNNHHTSPRYNKKNSEERNGLQNGHKSEVDKLLEEIRKFEADARREKANFIKSEEAIAGQLINNYSFLSMNGNSVQ